jgi:FAD dependent oxidoreductase TIGR03364
MTQARGIDVAIVGAGIVGLAHAWSAAKRGHAVTVLERQEYAQGASIRNFGMIWPIGQTPGRNLILALRSRTLWLEIARAAGLWHNPCGSIHLAYRDDELAVLSEFAERSGVLGYDCRLLNPKEVLERSPAANPEGLVGGLWSATEVAVDPRQAITTIPGYLAETFGVQFSFATPALRIHANTVHTADGSSYQADRIIVCNGEDLRTLFPDVFANSGIRRCKLQMLRTGPQPSGWHMGPLLASGLTLRHYPTFAACPSLPKLKQRIATESPELDRYGIHYLVSQHCGGEVVLGDSHEYDQDIGPFDKQEIDDLILAGMRRLIRLPDWTIQQRWHGIYAKHPTQLQFVADPQPGVHVVSATGGTGMTMAFALAEFLWENWGAPPTVANR